MRSLEEHAARVRDIFLHQGRTLTPADFIAAGVNPIMAWLYYKNFAPEAVLDHTDFADRMIADWPTGIEPPSPEKLLEWVLNPHPLDKLGATHIGQFSFDWKAIRDICAMLKITPDMLMPANHSVHSDKFDTTPAPSEYVEAGTQMFLEMIGGGINRPLLDFLYAECQKADRLGYASLYPGYPSNAKMMALAEESYDVSPEETPEKHLTTDEELPLYSSATYVIREEIDRICQEYKNQMGVFVRNLAKDIAVLSRGASHYQRILWDCSSAVAPMMEGSKWLVAFNKAKKDKGLEWAIKEVLYDPEAFYPVKQFFDSTTATLSDGRTVRGRGIIKAFCEAYRDFSQCCRDGEDPKKLAALAVKYDDAISRLVDFQTWRHAPQTKVYFKALANARHIEHEMGGWIPGPAARQTPPEGKPILRLPAPQRPAV